MKKKYILSFIAVGAVFALVLALTSRLCEPKYVNSSREGNLISEYYAALDAGERHDVVFIGDCEAYSSFVPPVLYEKYGIRSFVRGSPSQSMAQSYYLLCETLKHEKPKAVVFSVYAMCKSDLPKEAYNRMTLDGMRFSFEKMRSVYESAGDDESILSYYFPLLRFHSRVYELCDDDFKYVITRPSVSHNGYLMQKNIMYAEDIPKSEPEAEHLPRKNFKYLDKMRELCEEKGVRLILVKAPTDSWLYPWYESYDRELLEYAEHHKLFYYNLMNASDEMELATVDTYDGGLHLNVFGAEKVTVYFGKVLSETHNISGYDGGDAWSRKLERYYNDRNG